MTATTRWRTPLSSGEHVVSESELWELYVALHGGAYVVSEPEEVSGPRPECICNGKTSFSCLDCSVCTDCNAEYYMVHDHVWLAANPKDKGMLCVGCLESRLGRLLTKDDFTAAPLNTNPWSESERLATRRK
jgi:hypothetical protein